MLSSWHAGAQGRPLSGGLDVARLTADYLFGERVGCFFGVS